MAKQCLLCQQPLDAIERWGVHMDVCPKCRGVWLEQGELEQIKHRFEIGDLFDIFG